MRALTYQRAQTVNDIGYEMYRIAETYCNDLGEWGTLSFHDFFNRVKALPYRKEPGRFQLLSRPKWTMLKLSPVVACANKAILIGAYCKLHKIPFRFVAVGTAITKPVNHVFTQCFLNGNWENVDPTYSWHSPFHRISWARIIILKRKKK